MSYAYRPRRAPLTQIIDDLKAWTYRELQEVSNNLLARRSGWQDLRVPVTSTRKGGSKDPDFVKVEDDGSGSQGVFAQHFSPTQEEELYFEAQLQHGRVQNEDLRAHVHWLPTTTNTGTVRWGLEYTIANVNGTFGNTQIIYAEDAADGTVNKHQVKGFTYIDGSGVKDSAMLICRIFRDATHANDTYTGDAALLEVDFHVLLRQHGSDSEYGTVT